MTRNPSWRTLRDRYNRTTRELERLAADSAPPTVAHEGAPCPACGGKGGRATDKRGLRWRPCVACCGQKVVPS